jgi:hypothetical protein
MQVWSAYHLVVNNTYMPPTFPLADIAAAFKAIDSPQRRKAAGIELIAIQRKYAAGVLDPPDMRED